MLYLSSQHHKITNKTLEQFNQVTIIIGDRKFAITTEPKAFYLDLPKDKVRRI